MLLSDQSIQELLTQQKLKVTPEPTLKSASLRLHLSHQFAKPAGQIQNQDTYILLPKELILSSTLEHITMPNDHAGLYDGSTTLARFGITSHMGSMLISPGSDGNLTLEIFNASDTAFTLKADMRIGQLLILKMEKPSRHPQPTISSYTGDLHNGLVLPDQRTAYRMYQPKGNDKQR
jgi:dCTP deaminase